VSTSNVHRVYLAAVALGAFPVQSMPVSVSRGQTVVPLSVTFTNGGGPGASDIRLRALRFRLENAQGVGIVPAALLGRVTVNEGTNVYLDRTSLETTGSEVDLTLATPVLITGQEPVTLSLRVEVSLATVVPSFRLVLADSTFFMAEDAKQRRAGGGASRGRCVSDPVRRGADRVRGDGAAGNRHGTPDPSALAGRDRRSGAHALTS
jgi:hypothetical protein